MTILSILAGFGGVIMLVGWIWLIVVAGKTSGALWAIGVFFFGIPVGLIFCIINKTGWLQWGIMAGGFVLCMFGSFFGLWAYEWDM